MDGASAGDEGRLARWDNKKVRERYRKYLSDEEWPDLKEKYNGCML